jgi:hypothetical protein|tara:strand:+ start:63 stop:326 length:264 start_codon:yes stop_codon:yes gene_type:complete
MLIIFIGVCLKLDCLADEIRVRPFPCESVVPRLGVAARSEIDSMDRQIVKRSQAVGMKRSHSVVATVATNRFEINTTDRLLTMMAFH